MGQKRAKRQKRVSVLSRAGDTVVPHDMQFQLSVRICTFDADGAPSKRA